MDTLYIRKFGKRMTWIVPTSCVSAALYFAFAYTFEDWVNTQNFAMITAFLFWGRVLARGRTIDWVEFLVSRLYRLYPTYLLMFGLVLVAVFLSTSPGQPASAPSLPKALLEWLAMFGTPDLNGFPDTGLLVAGVTWSLRYEWLFYLSLPLFGCLAARSRQPLAALLSALVVSAVIYRSSFHSPFDIEILQSFLGGIVAAYWIRRPGLVRAARTAVAGCTAAMALAIVVTLTPSARTWEATLGLTVFFVIVASGQSLGGLLRRPALLWLGDITYSIYLFHGFLLWLTFRHLIPPGSAIDGVEFIVISVVVAISLVLLCSAVFLTIEHPAISMGKRHFHWMTRSATALRTALSR